MNGPVAQLVALTCHGNAFLMGHAIGQFFPNNSTCRFCECVTFVRINEVDLDRSGETEIANTPDAWYIFLKSQGACGIHLTHSRAQNPNMPDRKSAGFVGGGGVWTITVLFPDGTGDCWTSKWEGGNPQAQDRRIWRVKYELVSKEQPVHLPVAGLAHAAGGLFKSLKIIRSFSSKHNLDYFTTQFDDALDTLSSYGVNSHGYHHALIPSGSLPNIAEALLDACQTAWVFGGEGSWNDLGFRRTDQEDYERVSERLFQAITSAIEQAINSSTKKVEPGVPSNPHSPSAQGADGR